LVLRVAVDPDARVPDERGRPGIIFGGKVPGDGLVVHVGQEAVKPPAEHVIRVSRLFRLIVMDMVGDHISFFRDDLDHQVPHDKEPEPVGEGEGVVGGITVQVNRAMGPQDDHAVNEPQDEKFPGEVMNEKKEEKRREEKDHYPSEEGQPIFNGREHIYTGEKFPENFPACGNI